MSINKNQLDALNRGLFDSIGEEDSPDLATGSTLEEAMFNIAKQISEDLRDSATAKGVVATKQLRSSIDPTKARWNGNAIEVAVVMKKEWRWAEYGRGKGKRPPIAAIEEWITRKGIPVRQNKGQSRETVLNMRHSMAIAIAKKIAKLGTIKRFQYKGSRFIREVLTVEAMNQIAKHLSELQGRKIQLYFTVTSQK